MLARHLYIERLRIDWEFNYLGEKVVRENEYLSAMLSDAGDYFVVGIANLGVLFFGINLAIMRLLDVRWLFVRCSSCRREAHQGTEDGPGTGMLRVERQ